MTALANSMTDRPMKASAFRNWRATLNLSERAAAEKLGCSRGALRGYEQEGAPLYIALACAAIMRGLKPFTPKETEKK